MQSSSEFDEAYLDASSRESFEQAHLSMMTLKREILEQEGLGCSIGIAPNKLIAKIASSRSKPNGLTVITQQEIQEFLDSLPIRVIPGIGPKSEAFLHQQNVRLVRELREIPQATLTDWFGSWGLRLFEKARGIDDSAVSNAWTRKSIGEQETFEHVAEISPWLANSLKEWRNGCLPSCGTASFQGFVL